MKICWFMLSRANSASTRYQHIFFISITIRKLTKFQCIFDVVKIYKIYKFNIHLCKPIFLVDFLFCNNIVCIFEMPGWLVGHLVIWSVGRFFLLFFKYTHTIMIQSQHSAHFGIQCVYYIFDSNVYRSKQWSSFISNHGLDINEQCWKLMV